MRRYDQDRRRYNSSGKRAVPRHRTQSRHSSDAQERALETRTREAGHRACAEGLSDLD